VDPLSYPLSGEPLGLGVRIHDDSIHYLAYPDVKAPRRAHTPVLPFDDEISFLF
jgi:hypothetical protein